jgi:hypothetical protein
MGKLEVLLAMGTSVPVSASTCANSRCLSGRSSVAASTTIPTRGQGMSSSFEYVFTRLAFAAPAPSFFSPPITRWGSASLVFAEGLITCTSQPFAA